jgi:hypothetical protein
MEAKNTMRKVSVVLAGLLLFTNYSYADDHSTTALDQANLAIKEGSAGNASNLVKYASRALDKTLANSLTAKGTAKTRLNEAATELQHAIDHGNLGHPGEATTHTKTAAWHLKAANGK